MRALRVVGLGEDGASVVLESVPQRSGERPERFSVVSDERLQSAVRGDLPRLGQIEIELESQMRPREIQTRIRAGESVDQVAAVAGMPAQRVERFAYPVLLERSRTADLARRAHPVRPDGPDVRSLEEVVTGTFTRRGHDPEALRWDSWRGDDGKWVVQLRWRAGRSENKAHWTFHPGAHGGTVTTLDDHAVDLIDPEAGKPLRTVRPVTALAEQALALDGDAPGEQAVDERFEEHEEPAALAVPDDARGYRPPWAPERTTDRVERPVERRERPAERPADRRERPTERPADRPVERRERPADVPVRRDPAAQVPAAQVTQARPPAAPAPRRRAEPPAPVPQQAAPPIPQEAAPPAPPAPPAAPAAPAAEQPAVAKGRKGRPQVPSWEDVLLGVRSPRP